MKLAAMENPGSRQEELGQFLTATPVADFMASAFGSIPSATRSTPRDRWRLLVKAIIALWDDGNEPDEPQSLWLDVEQAIEEIELWVSSGDPSHIRSFRTSESSALVVIDELERVGFLGIGL